MMAYLEYISDDLLISEVKYLLDKAVAKRKAAEKDFNKNVIDPFGSLFESPVFDSHAEWKNSEMARQCQKTIQNHVGTFHQKILGHVAGWQDLGTGGVVDLLCEDKSIIAEVKNKYSTVTGGKLAEQYHSLEGLITPKHSRFKGYRAYFVNIIPKKPERINIPFTPSDKETGKLCASNDDIRVIDGASFYEIVTGRKDALKELHAVLPDVIEHIYRAVYGDEEFNISDKNEFTSYFDLAYKK
jgi:hypothetical protein